MTTTTAKVIPIGSQKPMSITTPGLGVQLLTAGSAACVADLITFPLDTAKVRLQVTKINFYSYSYFINLNVLKVYVMFSSSANPF